MLSSSPLIDTTSSLAGSAGSKTVKGTCTGRLLTCAIKDRNVFICLPFLRCSGVLAVALFAMRVCVIAAASSTDLRRQFLCSLESTRRRFWEKYSSFPFSLRSSFLWRDAATRFDACSSPSFDVAVFIFSSWVYSKIARSRAYRASATCPPSLDVGIGTLSSSTSPLISTSFAICGSDVYRLRTCASVIWEM